MCGSGKFILHKFIHCKLFIRPDFGKDVSEMARLAVVVL